MDHWSAVSFPYFTASVLPQTLVLPVEDPGNKHLADWSRKRRELDHSRQDVQAAVDEVAEGIDLILRVLLGRGVRVSQPEGPSRVLWQGRGSRFLP